MESIVHQPLGNVYSLYTCCLLEVSHINDELVSNEVSFPLVQSFVVIAQSQRHVVGIQDCYLSCSLQTLSPHHLDVCPGYGEDGSGTIWRSLTIGSGWLHSSPWCRVVPGCRDPLVCVPDTSIGQHQPSRLSPCSQIKVCKFDLTHGGGDGGD